MQKSEILTLPNAVTLIRFSGIPIFVWLLFGLENRLAAAALLGGLAATDWVDGYLARKLDQESSVGRVMDPTVDRLLILVSISCLLLDESVPFLFGIISLGREVVISLAVLILSGLKLDVVKVNWYGKAGTFALFFSFPLFLLSEASVPSGVESAARTIAWISGVPGLTLSYIALVLYFFSIKSQLQKK